MQRCLFSGESAIRAGMNRGESAGSAESGNCGAIGWNDGIVWCADSYAWMTIYECAGDEYQTINGVSLLGFAAIEGGNGGVVPMPTFA